MSTEKTPEIILYRVKHTDEKHYVKHYDHSASCGELFDSGEIPKVVDIAELLKLKDYKATAIAQGDSLRDFGISNGDILFLREDNCPQNGDLVVATLDGESTVKVFDYNQRTNTVTLYPANPNYDKIVIRGEDLENLRFTAVIQSYMHIFTSRTLILKTVKRINETRDERIRIEKVQPLVQRKRYWFAACKAMMELGIVDNKDFSTALDIISETTGETFSKIDTNNIYRLDIDGFRRPIKEWNEKDAPVKNPSFNKYKRIAMEFLEG